jgi:hypothetical protein
MSTQLDAPKIFISYSWKPAAQKQKVLELAQRLVNDGVHVVLDEWDLRVGQEKYQFMEQMVNNPDVKFVLLICNKDYSEKANNKKGGVGIESMIVSDEIYTKTEQTKFVPVIFEYHEGKPCVPTFVISRIFIDLSNEEVFEDEYEKLMRHIFDKPAVPRPALGSPPAYITEKTPIFLPTAHKVNRIKQSLLDDKRNAAILIDEYLEIFVESLKNYIISYEEIDNVNCIDLVTNGIYKLQPLKDDFIDFLNVYATYSPNFDSEKMHGFFERLLEFLLNLDGINDSNTLHGMRLDNLKYFLHELFITSTAILLQKEKFKELGYILHTPFIITRERYNDTNQYYYTYFRQFAFTLDDYRNRILNARRVSYTADLIKERATVNLPFSKLQEADAMLYYISLLLSRRSIGRDFWFPITSCYGDVKFSVLQKGISKRYFAKMLPIFNCQSKLQLAEKMALIKAEDGALNALHFNVRNIQSALDLEKLDTLI